MGYHLLAVFSGTTARPPAGLESPLAAASHKGRTFFDVDHEELERKVSETLEVCSSVLDCIHSQFLADHCFGVTCLLSLQSKHVGFVGALSLEGVVFVCLHTGSV